MIRVCSKSVGRGGVLRPPRAWVPLQPKLIHPNDSQKEAKFMATHSLIADAPRWRQRGLGGKLTAGSLARRQAALHEEIYMREVTDRESLYGDSFACEWCRQSNLSPDDFE